MKYYIEKDGDVWAFEEDGSQDFRITSTMRAMTEAEVYLHLNPPPTPEELAYLENQWREQRMLEVADQLLMIEDDDPNAKPGTARQWRDYRIQLRLWTDTNPDFPDISKRPVAPT